MNASRILVKPGNSIPRIYKKTRIAKGFAYTLAGTELAAGVCYAKQKDTFCTCITGLLGCTLLKLGNDLSDFQKTLKPHYQQIVERAKKIKAAKK